MDSLKLVIVYKIVIAINLYLAIDTIDEESIKDEYTEKTPVEKDEFQKVDGRWLYHLVMVFNAISTVWYALYGFILLLLSVMLWDTTIVARDYFYNYGLMYNFTRIPNGELIDMCYQNGTVENYFNIREHYNFYLNYTSVLTHLK